MEATIESSLQSTAVPKKAGTETGTVLSLWMPTPNTIAERLFSSSKNTISDRRTKFGADKVNKLLFPRKTYWYWKVLIKQP